jgi:hypothetical protein
MMLCLAAAATSYLDNIEYYIIIPQQTLFAEDAKYISWGKKRENYLYDDVILVIVI